MDEGIKKFFINMSNELMKKFSSNFSRNTKLANYSWFNLGGPAEYFFKPDDKKQLIEFLRENKNKNKLKITVLGAGSNTLIRDNGIKGVVIKLGSGFSKIKLISDNLIEAGASILDRKISSFAKEKGTRMNILEAAWKTNLEVRPEEDWKDLKGRAVSDE